jgi:hypothetical protein
MKRTSMRTVAGWTGIVLAVLIPSGSRAEPADVTSPRNAVINAAGAREIKIDAGAGFLHINGRNGINDVRVTGVARASNRRILDEIRLIAERRGDVVFIKAEFPDDRSIWDLFHGDFTQMLDLTIDVPISVPLNVADGSGELNF